MNNFYYTNNELTHYGVLGMKWGIRKAAKQGKSYRYKSRSQQKANKRVTKLESKGKTGTKAYSKAKRKQGILRTRDANRERYVRTTNVGKRAATTVLTGIIGTGTYARMRSAGYGRITSYASATIGNALLTPLGMTAVSHIYEKSVAKRNYDGEVMARQLTGRYHD